MTDIVERLRTSTEWAHCKHSMREEAAAEIERLKKLFPISYLELYADNERLRALLLRHQVAAWCEEDSDLAVETRRALEPKPVNPKES